MRSKRTSDEAKQRAASSPFNKAGFYPALLTDQQQRKSAQRFFVVKEFG
jgi:hypothetical protein